MEQGDVDCMARRVPRRRKTPSCPGNSCSGVPAHMEEINAVWNRRIVSHPRPSQMNGIIDLKWGGAGAGVGGDKDQKSDQVARHDSHDDKMAEWVTPKALRVQHVSFEYLYSCLLMSK